VALGETLLELQQLTERLRRDCPWDREQTARTIVPHTIEEAYEVADAALADDRAKLLDELGDLLFQVYFLALLLQERGEGDLEQVARRVHEKLVRRHPHVFGDTDAPTAGRVRENWERRARDVGFEYPDLAGALADLESELAELKAELTDDPAPETEADRRHFEELGDLLFAVVNVGRRLNVDPELALRSATARFRARVERAEELAAEEGSSWAELPLEAQDRYFDQAKEALR
jgi:uncharacterized protein YabN with tetrapyrrole methylase and pyrophosphatase domain